MESSRLEQLEQCLRDALRLAERGESEPGQVITASHPAALAAIDCELMLPEPLTPAALVATIRHRIDNVQVLLARAREHEKLPADAQLAADEGYLTGSDGVPGDKQ